MSLYRLPLVLICVILWHVLGGGDSKRTSEYLHWIVHEIVRCKLELSSSFFCILARTGTRRSGEGDGVVAQRQLDGNRRRYGNYQVLAAFNE